MALIAPHKAFIEKGATAHMTKDLSVATMKAALSYISTVTVRKDTIKTSVQGQSFSKLSGRE